MAARPLDAIPPGGILYEVDYDLRVAKRTAWLKAEHRMPVYAA